MADATAKLLLPFPAATDPDDVPGYIQDLAEAVESVLSSRGLLANRPAPGQEGRFYDAIDDGIFRDNGTEWDELVTRAAADAAYVARADAQTAPVGASESTTATAYSALATPGPAVTATVGPSGKALVIVTAMVSNNTATSSAFSMMAWAVSGATTRVAQDDEALIATSSIPGALSRQSAVTEVVGLTPGVNTFTSQYKVGAGTGTFARRAITVIPL